MELDRLRTAWQQQPLEGAAARRVEDIMGDVRERAAMLDRRIRRRDMLETLAGLVVIPAFSFIAWVAPEPLEKVGAGVVVAGCLSIILRLFVVRNRHRPRPDWNAREFCANELKRVDEQIRLLSTVGWWYVAPLLGGISILLFGGHGSLALRGVMLTGMALMAVVIVWMNRRAADHHLQPMRDDLARTLRDMIAPEA